MWGQEPWFDRSHNIFFDWLINAGLLGLLAGGMLVDDPAIKDSIQEALGDAKLAFEIIGVAIVILLGTYLKKKNAHQEA